MATFREIYRNTINDRETKILQASQFVEKIADITKKSPATVKMWGTGLRNPSKISKVLIADELGVDETELFPEIPDKAEKVREILNDINERKNRG